MNYPSLIDTAYRLIDQAGGDVSFTTQTASTTTEYDPATGGFVTVGDPPVTVTRKAVLTRYNRQEGFVPDTTTLSNAAKVLIAGSLEIEVGQFITIDGTEYQVVYKDKTRPNVKDTVLTTLVVSL
jgi:hypothetical protein